MAFSACETPNEPPPPEATIASVEIIGDASELEIGTDAQLSAIVKDSEGKTTDSAVRWSSSNETVLTVDSDGLVSAVAVGTAAITASVEDQSDNLSITVFNVVTELDVAVEETTLPVGGAGQLEVTLIGKDGSEIERGPTGYSSSDPAVVSVGDDGRLTARSVGEATVTASYDEISGSVDVEVIRSITLRYDQTSLIPDEQTLYAAEVLSTLDGEPTADVSWSSSAPSVATIDENGIVTAVGVGSTTISATRGRATEEVPLVVVAAPFPDLDFQYVAAPFDPRPSYLSAPPGDPRLFVSTLKGEIWTINRDGSNRQLFLDIRTEVGLLGESGLLSFAFHPDFDENRYIYMNFVDPDQNVRLIRVTANEAVTAADASTIKELLSVSHPPNGTHFGGRVLFGGDGMLYMGIGDGGFEVAANARSTSTLLGKMIRIDVDRGDPYAIPADNPYAGTAGARGEIWAIGLRNPWRMSFDPVTSDFYIADVGEGTWEEVNVIGADEAGTDFGWVQSEGDQCFPIGSTGCGLERFELPVLQYTHFGKDAEATTPHPSGCSITGGAVYRGSAIPSLRGRYLYSDFCSGWVATFRLNDKGKPAEKRHWSSSQSQVVSFGMDSDGELYLLAGKAIYRIVAAP